MGHDEDPFALRRFVEAQDEVIDAVRKELRAGCKTSHWMWFVFPQLRGLGRSPMAERYGISGRAEARAYLDHPELGPRLTELVGIVADLEDTTALRVFGPPDDLKFRSCLTLFLAVDPQRAVFRRALERYFDGALDQTTLQLLNRNRSAHP